MGKHCHDEGCPGVYEANDTCSHCGKPDTDTLPYIHLDIPAAAIKRLSRSGDSAKLQIQVKLDNEGVVVDVLDLDYSSDEFIATAAKMYSDMGISVRRWYEGEVPSATELCQLWKQGKHAEVIKILVAAHPCVTAMMLVVGATEQLLNRGDCNSITNLLTDNKVEENERFI
jgi:hypothetical protein